MKHFYYLPFIPDANINYLYLLAFYDLAEYNTETKVFDTIKYTSIKSLAETLNISSATVNRILKNEAYNKFLKVDKESKTI